MVDVIDREPLLDPGDVTVAPRPRSRAFVGRCIGDFLFVSVIITPSVLLFWRGTWNLLLSYLPGGDSFRLWLCLSIGIPGILLVGLLQHHFGRLGRWMMEKNYCVYRLFLCVYLYVAAFAGLAQWAAFWNLPAYYLPEIDSVIGSGVRAILGFIFMVISRTVVQGRACPASAVYDFDPEPFRVSLRFRTDRAGGFSWKFFLDVVFSLIVLDLIAVQNWAGTWALLDNTIFPYYPCFSSWISVIIGYAIHLLASLVQFPLQQASKNLTGGRWEFCKRLAIEGSFGLVVNFGVNNVWRGLWGVYDCYILYDQPLMSAWLTHGLGAALCFVLCAGSSLGRVGVSVDGEAEDGTGVLLLSGIGEVGVTCCRHDNDGMDTAINDAAESTA